MAWTTPATFTAGSVLTAAQLNTNVRDNTNALYQSIQRLGYSTKTTNYTTAATTVTSANNIFNSSVTWTADGTSAYRIEFWCTEVATASNAGAGILVALVNGAGTDLGYIGSVRTGNGTYPAAQTLHAVMYYTPAAGSTTINARAIHSVAAGTLTAGAGATAAASWPMWLAVFGPPMT